MDFVFAVSITVWTMLASGYIIILRTRKKLRTKYELEEEFKIVAFAIERKGRRLTKEELAKVTDIVKEYNLEKRVEALNELFYGR